MHQTVLSNSHENEFVSKTNQSATIIKFSDQFPQVIDFYFYVSLKNFS